jgi:RHS repeat-associated protein
MALLTGGVSLSVVYPNYRSRLIARKHPFDHIGLARTKHSSHTKLFSNSLVACTHDLNPDGVRTIMTRQVLFVAFLIFMFCGLGLAQNLDYVDVERPQNTPLIRMPIGFISPLSGQVHIEIPLLELPTRDGLSIRAAMKYDTAFWAVSHQGFAPQTGSDLKLGGEQELHGYRYTVTTTTSHSCPAGWTGTESVKTLKGVLDATGLHPVSGNYYVTTFSCENANGNWYNQPPENINVRTDDGEYFVSMSVIIGGGGSSSVATIAWAADGTTFDTIPYVDTNGNYISGSSPLSAPYTTNPLSTSGGNTWCFTMPDNSTAYINIIDSNGSTDTYTVNCTTYVSSGNSVKVLTSFILPDTTRYTFTYDPSHDYVLNRVTLPTGGQISFTYSSTPRYDGIYPQLASATFEGGTWTFNQTHSGSAVTTTVTAPPRFDVLSQSYVQDTSIYTGDVGPQGSFLGEARYYSGSTTLLKTIDLTYFYQCLASVSTTLNDTGQTAKIQYSYGTAGCSPAQKQEFDYGASTPTRTTVYQYLGDMSGGIAYNSQYHIYNRPVSISVYPGANTSGTPMQQTIYTYDEYSQNYCTSGIPNLTNITGALMHDDTNHGGTFYARGNVTSTKKLVSGSSYVTSHACYDTLGNVTQTVDEKGNPTTFDYTENWADSTCVASGSLTRAFASVVTDALGFRQKTTRASCTGLKTAVADENDLRSGRAGSTFTYDREARPLCVNDPDGGQSCNAYFMTAQPPYTTQTTLINSSLSKTSKTVLDSFGRVQQTQLTSDPGGTTYTLIMYDALGRESQVYNPTRCNPVTTNCGEPTWGYTTYNYDALGRTTRVTHSDGTFVATSYKGRATDVLDEGNGTRSIERVSQVDGLGRLVSICEVTGTAQLGAGGTPAACGQDIAKTGFLTSYSYDVLGNLLTVNQGSLGQRTFAYDSLSRLLCTANPETGTAACPSPDNGTYTAGTTRYAYDANGNLSSRTRPAPNLNPLNPTVTTTYQYDALDRLTQKSYSDTVPTYTNGTPTVMYGYDQTSITMGSQQFSIYNNIGRMSWSAPVTQAWYTISMNAFSYDPMGRIAELWQSNPVNSNNIFVSYGYDFLGDETSRSLSGDTYAATYNGAGRLTSFTATDYTDATNPANLLTSVQYDSFGHIISGNLANGLSLSSGYDARGRVTAMAVGTNCSVGNCSTNKYRFTTAYAPNSDIASSMDTVNGNWTYTYDDLNRLSTGVANNGEGCSWDYDRYGNRWHQNQYNGTCFTPTFSFTGNNNRIDGYSYDAAGNLLSDRFHTYQYDAENRIVSVDNGATTYTYDAEDRRVAKNTSGSLTDFIYDREGHAILTNPATPTFIEMYAAGMHLGTYIVNSALTDTIFYYDHDDWLGTERARTDLSGTACETISSLPFGDNQTITSTCGDLSPLHFTGKERDSESGLDNFGKRYNASSLGRFMSPDPFIPFNLKKDKFEAWISNPQHWNKYAYALNNPLLYVDPSGMTETIYYWLNSSLTDAQKKYFQEHKTDILNAIASKLKEAGIKDVVFKEGSSLSDSQVKSMLQSQPKGVAFLNFANKSYGGINAPPDQLGVTDLTNARSAVFVGNLQAGNPSAAELSFRISEVSDHELGHGIGFYSRGPAMSFIEFWNRDLMNEGQGMPTGPRHFDMSIPQNRQAADEINEQPEH